MNLNNPPSQPQFDSINNDIPTLLKSYGLENEVHNHQPLHKAILEKNTSLIHEIMQSTSPEILCAVTPKFQLTPLHIAAITGDIATCTKLLELKTNPNPRDWKGWTPLHHAALFGYEKLIQLLIEFGADIYLKSGDEGTFQDILYLTNYSHCDDNELLPVYYENDGGAESQLTAREWRNLTGSNYLKEDIVCREFFIKNWIAPSSDRLYSLFASVALKAKDKLPLFLEKPPKFCLYHAKKNETGLPLECHPGLGLKARTVLETGDIIGEYIGLYETPMKFSDSLYAVRDGPDAELFGNEISRSNDGFPNCFLIYVPNDRGLPTRSYLIAIERIEPGQQILWDYGKHPVKFGPYAEFRPHSLRELLKKYSMKILFDMMTSAESDKGANLAQFAIGAKVRYLINTPALIFTLLLEKYLKISEASLIGIVNMLYGPIEYVRISDLTFSARNCLEIYERICKTDPGIAEEFLTYFKNLTHKIPLIEVLQREQISSNSFKEFFKQYPQQTPSLLSNHWTELMNKMHKDIR